MLPTKGFTMLEPTSSAAIASSADETAASRLDGRRGSCVPLVVHVFPTFAVGGAQARFATLANQLGSNYRHLVVALDGNLSARGRISPALDVGFPVVHAPKHAMLGNMFRFRALLRAWQPDVLVTYNWGAIEFALANLLPVARHIHVEDGFGPEERSGQMGRRVMLRRLALWRSTVVLPSRTLERIATDIWHLPRSNVHYVPNGIDLARFVVRTGCEHGGDTVIGTVAALRTEKNLGRLLAVFARVAATRSVRLVIVGDGPERAALQAHAASLGLGQLVTFTGHREDTPTLYAGFDLFALSSDTEQMPLSVLEAMASGLAVAATDVGDVRLMLAEDNAPFVTPLDDAVLAAAIARLVDDPGLRMRLGAANRVKAEREFDQTMMVQHWRALWDGTTLAR
jgi:glycosyltransferase involved in cell wall biosynthesis